MAGIGRWMPQRDADRVRPGKPSTLVELTGRGRVIVENHRGIRHYGDDRILIGTSYGLLEICGNGLRLRFMGKEHMCILGCIDTVMLLGRNERGSVE